MGLAGACGRRGVEMAHVVAGLVRAQLRELGPAADTDRSPLAGHPARDQPHHQQVDRVDEPVDDRPGALTPGGGAARSERPVRRFGSPPAA